MEAVATEDQDQDQDTQRVSSKKVVVASTVTHRFSSLLWICCHCMVGSGYLLQHHYSKKFII
jgi:hypothetical protein